MLIKSPRLRYWVQALIPVAEALIAGAGRAAVGSAAKEAGGTIAKNAVKGAATKAVGGGDGDENSYTAGEMSGAISRIGEFNFGSRG
jgi:hypothetical protein